ncbi:MAG: hypothetical protein AAGC55_20605, partial [Myxococcota bacterium]
MSEPEIADNSSRPADTESDPPIIRGVLIGVIASVVVAVAMFAWVTAGGGESVRTELDAYAGPSRAIEGRLSYPGVTAYFPYRPAVVRQLPLPMIDRLVESGDLHGAAVAHLLMVQTEQARPYLEQAAPSTELFNDRAAALLIAGDAVGAERALVMLDRVLTDVSDHGPALWNRALALAALGRTDEAAVVFDVIAGRGEAGWSEEAAER